MPQISSPLRALQPALSRLPRALRRGGDGDRYLVLTLAAWVVWVLCTVFWAGVALGPLLRYLSFPIALIGGVLVGRCIGQRETGPMLPGLLAGAAGTVLLMIPFYANAQAAWGMQLVAWAGLRALRVPKQGLEERRHSWSVVALCMLALVGVLLVSRAQATSVLVVPFALLVLAAVAVGFAPRRLPVGIIGLSTVGAAAVTIISLASLSAWPEALNAGRSLSSTRHRLWADALELWQASPVIGAGPGAFLANSDIAATDPMLQRAHSSILQVGAELGSIGVILFLGILVAGAAVALQGSKPAALIAVAAWCALAVHSMIDHLYEYPLVVLTAGIVLGYAGQQRHQDGAPDAVQ